ncbi:MAG: hypothetical protein ABIJ14_03035 [Nanoarchaeota archaeon]|nr:hypothetical protein [Nanoarchaeota archaeon]
MTNEEIPKNMKKVTEEYFGPRMSVADKALQIVSLTELIQSSFSEKFCPLKEEMIDENLSCEKSSIRRYLVSGLTWGLLATALYLMYDIRKEIQTNQNPLENKVQYFQKGENRK